MSISVCFIAGFSRRPVEMEGFVLSFLLVFHHYLLKLTICCFCLTVDPLPGKERLCGSRDLCGQSRCVSRSAVSFGVQTFILESNYDVFQMVSWRWTPQTLVTEKVMSKTISSNTELGWMTHYLNVTDCFGGVQLSCSWPVPSATVVTTWMWWACASGRTSGSSRSRSTRRATNQPWAPCTTPYWRKPGTMPTLSLSKYVEPELRLTCSLKPYGRFV